MTNPPSPEAVEAFKANPCRSCGVAPEIKVRDCGTTACCRNPECECCNLPWPIKGNGWNDINPTIARAEAAPVKAELCERKKFLPMVKYGRRLWPQQSKEIALEIIEAINKHPVSPMTDAELEQAMKDAISDQRGFYIAAELERVMSVAKKYRG